MRVTQRRYTEAGVTSVRVPGLRPGELGVYQDLLRTDGRLGTRVAAGPRIDPTAGHDAKLWTIASGERVPGVGDWLRPDAVKLFVDGGIETALDGTTHLFLEGEELRDLVAAAVVHGWSVACHAVTPEAVALTLDAYRCAAGTAAKRGSRLTIEHGFLAEHEQLTTAADLGVWLSTQPAVGFVEAALLRGQLPDAALARVFPLRSALDAGVRCALGSDWNATPGTSVRPFAPLESIRAAVARTGADGLPFGRGEAIDPVTAIHLHTRAPARLAGFADAGGLWPGALADLVALTADPLTDLTSTQVAAVFVGGRPARG
jgi:predicted amidohydrolase YtcJ